MNLKKLLLLVFMYMMEEEKEELDSTFGKLSVGGLIHIAKMAGLNNVGALMAQMKKLQFETMKKDPTGEATSYWISEIYHELSDEFEEKISYDEVNQLGKYDFSLT